MISFKSRKKENIFSALNTANTVFSSVGVLAGLYLSLSPRFATKLYSNALFNPDQFPLGNYHIESVNGVKLEDIEFSSHNGNILHGWYFQNKKAKKTVLFSHGNAGNITTRIDLIKSMLEAGVSVFVYDYQGYGKSGGSATIQNIINDGLSAYDYLTQELKISASEIIIYGESLGAAVSCQISKYRTAAGLILQSGFSSLQKIGQELVPFTKIYPSWLFTKPDLNNLAVVAKQRCPLLIIHGVRDNTIPYSHAEELFAAAAEPKYLKRMENSDHTEIPATDPDDHRNAISEFIASL